MQIAITSDVLQTPFRLYEWLYFSSYFIQLMGYYSFLGPVHNFTYSVTSSTTAMVHWEEPLVPNGDITKYELSVSDTNGKLVRTLEYNRRGVSLYGFAIV